MKCLKRNVEIENELTGFEEIAGFDSAPQQWCSKNCSSLSLNSALVLDLKSEEVGRLDKALEAEGWA